MGTTTRGRYVQYHVQYYVQYDGIHLAPILQAIKKSNFLEEVKMRVSNGVIASQHFKPLFRNAMRHTILSSSRISTCLGQHCRMRIKK